MTDKAAFPKDGVFPQPGMTMREWYAGMALQGILAGCGGDDAPFPSNSEAVGWAFEYADAMLVEARKEKTT